MNSDLTKIVSEMRKAVRDGELYLSAPVLAWANQIEAALSSPAKGATHERLLGRLEAYAKAMTECSKSAPRSGGSVGRRDCSEIRMAIDILHLDTLRELDTAATDSMPAKGAEPHRWLMVCSQKNIESVHLTRTAAELAARLWQEDDLEAYVAPVYAAPVPKAAPPEIPADINPRVDQISIVGLVSLREMFEKRVGLAISRFKRGESGAALRDLEKARIEYEAMFATNTPQGQTPVMNPPRDGDRSELSGSAPLSSPKAAPAVMDLGKVREALERIKQAASGIPSAWDEPRRSQLIAARGTEFGDRVNRVDELARNALALLDSLAPDGRKDRWPMDQECAFHGCQYAAGKTILPVAPLPDAARHAQENKDLGLAIRKAAVKAGICREDVRLTGPHLIMLCNDLADAAIAFAPPAKQP